MIPKVIHYCWFGRNPLTPMAEKCIASWKRYCPDYEIRRWDETNFDINFNDYVREAYDSKKWAFITDVVRLYALYNFGGIYMDTDVEVVNKLDSLLAYDAVSGFESHKSIPTGLMAAKPGHSLIKELLDEYEDARFIDDDGEPDTTTNVVRITNKCLEYGFVPNNTKQTIHGMTFLPKDYLCPKDHRSRELEITENTLTIHHFDGSWLDEDDLRLKRLRQRAPRVMPRFMVYAFTKLYVLMKYHGASKTLKYVKKKIRS